MHVVSCRPQYVENTLLQNKWQEKEKEERKFDNSTRKYFNKIIQTNQGKFCIQTPTNTTDSGLATTLTSPSDEENTCYTPTNLNEDVPLRQQSYCVDVADDEIYIKSRNCNKQSLATTNANIECITQINCNNSNSNRNSSNKFLDSIISILHCKQFKPKQQQQEQQLQLYYSHHYFTSTSSKPTTMASSAITTTTTSLPVQHQLPPTQLQHEKLLSHLYNFNNFYKDPVYIIYIVVISYLLLTALHHLPLMVDASCRDESSRSCEAICRPLWAQDNYLSTMMHPYNLTLEPFSSDDYNCTIRALVLLPDDDRYLASLRRVVPILKVAVQQIHASGLLPSYIQFDWMPQDDKCDAAFATVKAMDGIVRNCAHVVFGPVCDYPLAAVGRIAKYFNSDGTPLISVGGSTFDFEKPKTKCTDEFYMLLRTGMLSFETMSELTISVMKRNNWSRSIFFYDRDGQRNVAGLHTCYLMMTSLGEQMRKENMTFAQHPIQAKLKNRTEEMIREIGNKHTGKW